MTLDELARRMQSHVRELRDYVQRSLPVKVGVKAKSVFQENFRKGGFQDGSSFERWLATKRQLSGGTGADSKRGPLLSSRKVLYNSIGYVPGKGRVVVSADVVYAALHNEGGAVSPRVTPKMRRYAWARYYEAGGGAKGKGRKASGSAEASRWKGLALTKRKTLHIAITRRHFLGPTETLSNAVQTTIEQDLTKILNK